MGHIKILSDTDGGYGYLVGEVIDINQLFKDFKESDDCDDKLYEYLCRIPIPYAVDMIAEKWGLDYAFV